MRKFGGSGEGLCSRCNLIAGDCHCLRNAGRRVNHKEESDRDSRSVDDVIEDMEDNGSELFNRQVFRIN